MSQHAGQHAHIARYSVPVQRVPDTPLGPQRRKFHEKDPYLVAVLTAICGTACAATPNSDSSLPRTTDQVTTTTRTPPLSTCPAPPTTQQPTTTTTAIPKIDSGTYIDGTEIQPGQYRVAGYWERLGSDFDIIRDDGTYLSTSLIVIEALSKFLS